MGNHPDIKRQALKARLKRDKCVVVNSYRPRFRALKGFNLNWSLQSAALRFRR